MSDEGNNKSSREVSVRSAPECSPAANRQSSPLNCRYHLKYEWLKGPSVLLMLVGFAGLAADKWPPLKRVLSLLDLPPFVCSLIIIVLAAILLLVALTAKDSRGIPNVDSQRDGWRSI